MPKSGSEPSGAYITLILCFFLDVKIFIFYILHPFIQHIGCIFSGENQAYLKKEVFAAEIERCMIDAGGY